MSYRKCRMCEWSDERPVAYHWIVRSPGILFSANKLGTNNQTNYRYRQARKRFARELKEQLNLIPRANKFRAGLITRYYDTTKNYRAYDLENLAGGCKGLIDVLQSYGAIVKDSPNYWRGYYAQDKVRGGGCYYTIDLWEFAD